MAARIIHFGKYSIASNGGIEKVLSEFSENGESYNHEFITYCKDETKSQPSELSFPIDLFILGQPFSIGYSLKFLSMLFQREHLVLHFPNLNIFVFLFLLMFCGNYSIFWHADPLVKKIPSNFINGLVGIITWTLLYRANVIFVTSPQYKEASPFLTFVKKKCSIVPIGVQEQSVISSSHSRNKRRHGHKIKILFVGRLVKYKGVDDLVRAMSFLPHDVRLEIVGDGPALSSLSTLSYQLGTDNRIKFKGTLKLPALKASYDRCDVFVLPSTNRAEAYGIVLLEAMTKGLPFIIRPVNGSGMRFIHENSMGNYCCDGMGVLDLVKTILEVTDNVRQYGSGITSEARAENMKSMLDTFSSKKFIKLCEQNISKKIKSVRTVG